MNPTPRGRVGGLTPTEPPYTATGYGTDGGNSDAADPASDAPAAPVSLVDTATSPVALWRSGESLVALVVAGSFFAGGRL